MLWSLPLVPLIAGAAIWIQPRRGRLLLGTAGSAALLTTLALAGWAATARPSTSLAWGVEGLAVTGSIDAVAAVMAVLVPAVAAPIVVYAAAYEPLRGLGRLIGLLVAFVGAMELLVVAADLLTLLIGWELVGWASWALIAHEWREPGSALGAAHAFNTTRFGDLGLFLAAMAAYLSTGSLRYADLPAVGAWPAHALAAGIVVAAAAKSAQLPFSPWLFSAMAGPTPVSALLHAATMVAAGAYVLIRLHPVLSAVDWFEPATVAVGSATALSGGIVAVLQSHAKRLLAASTSAQYGLMFVAVGAGFPAVGLAHLVAHGMFKALLFLAAGVAIAAAGTAQLEDMRVGSGLRVAAWLTLPGSLALAGVPPLGGAWTKEAIGAAAGHVGAWVAVLVMVAGGVSACYAVRFQWLAFGRSSGDRPDVERPTPAVEAAMGALALATVALGLMWLPAVRQRMRVESPAAEAWEVAGSLALVAIGLYAGYALSRLEVRETWAAGWLGLPALAQRVVVDPVLSLAAALARLDDRVVDAGARGAAAAAAAAARALTAVGEVSLDRAITGAAASTAAGAARVVARADDVVFDGAAERLAVGVGFAGRHSRRLQSGMAHHYYLFIAVGLVVLGAVAVLWGA